MDLSELTDLTNKFVSARQDRLDADKAAKALKEIEQELKGRVVQEMIKHGCGMVGGETKKVTLQTKRKPMAADWLLLSKYIMENDAVDLLQRRLAEGAINERFEDGVEIPGVEFYEVNDLSVGKL